MQKINNNQTKRRRRFLLMVPVLTIPSLIILFIALGGGKTKDDHSSNNTPIGLNTQLPPALLKKEKKQGRIGLYELATKDSIKTHTSAVNSLFENSSSFSSSPFAIDTSENKMNEKILRLRSIIKQRSTAADYYTQKTIVPNPNPRLEQATTLVRSIHEKQRDEDPEIKNMNQVLDKIMQIQHPETITDSLQRISAKNTRMVYPVGNVLEDETDSDGFNTTMSPATKKISNRQAIRAVVNKTQTILNGDPIQIRLLDDIFIEGIRIPKNELIWAICQQGSDRLKIAITSISYDDNIYPVALEGYDQQGMNGIYIPGNATHESLKQSAQQSLGSIGLTSLDPSIGAQAASAGIQAVKTLAGKKIRLTKFTIPSGYHILFINKSKP